MIQVVKIDTGSTFRPKNFGHSYMDRKWWGVLESSLREKRVPMCGAKC